MGEEGRKKDTIFLSVIGIATLLVAIIGATFAWFSATVTGNETASSVTVTTATLGIIYTNGNEIVLDRVEPQDTSDSATSALIATDQTKTFTIEPAESANVVQNYTINWDIATFDFAQKEELVYSLSGKITGSPTGGNEAGTLVATKTGEAMPANTGVTAIGTGQVSPGETHTYTLTVWFKETGSNQNYNQGKTFRGKIYVTTDEVSA